MNFGAVKPTEWGVAHDRACFECALLKEHYNRNDYLSGQSSEIFAIITRKNAGRQDWRAHAVG